jgi:hypothetical protein
MEEPRGLAGLTIMYGFFSCCTSSTQAIPGYAAVRFYVSCSTVCLSKKQQHEEQFEDELAEQAAIPGEGAGRPW